MDFERLVVLCCFHIQCMALESGSKVDTGFHDGVLKVSFAQGTREDDEVTSRTFLWYSHVDVQSFRSMQLYLLGAFELLSYRTHAIPER